MSASPPLSPNEAEVPRPSPNSVTRTVAIIKNHALGHRFDIERRIQEASFEVSCLNFPRFEAHPIPTPDRERTPDGIRRRV
jgi:hypothetical protein